MAKRKNNKVSNQDIELMKRACLLCDNATCGYKTGCVVVRDGKVLVEGWNETLPGEIYCQDRECIREKEGLSGGKEIQKVCSIHAEAAVVAKAAKEGFSLVGATVYVTTFPCIICARLLVKAGISKLFYMSDYAGNVGLPLFEKNKVKVERIEERGVWQRFRRIASTD